MIEQKDLHEIVGFAVGARMCVSRLGSLEVYERRQPWYLRNDPRGVGTRSIEACCKGRF